jgi:hypothetical protein
MGRAATSGSAERRSFAAERRRPFKMETPNRVAAHRGSGTMAFAPVALSTVSVASVSAATTGRSFLMCRLAAPATVGRSRKSGQP